MIAAGRSTVKAACLSWNGEGALLSSRVTWRSNKMAGESAG